ncbi:MAG: flagellin [Candidatus Sericytochromatia bacterium]
MRIRTDSTAMTTHRHLARADGAFTRALERLGSGLRLNRASDDAAGLGMSERMRGQVRGTAQAMRNVQEGLSLCHIADAALQQYASILQRVRELAVQAANGTYTDEARQAIQAEISGALATLDGLATRTDGGTDGVIKPLMQVAPPPSGLPPGTAPAEDFVFVLDNSSSTGAIMTQFVNELATFAAQTQILQPGSRFGVVLTNNGNVATNGDATQKVLDLTADLTQMTQANLSSLIMGATGNGSLNRGGSIDYYASMLQTLAGNNPDGDSDGMAWDPARTKRFIVLTDVQREIDAHAPGLGAFNETQASVLATLLANNARVDVTGTPGVTNSANATRGLGDIITGTGGVFTDKNAGLSAMLAQLVPPPVTPYTKVHLQVGANLGEEMILELSDVRLATLGLTTLNVGTQADAQAAIQMVDGALGVISRELAMWGGYESRLAHTANNLGVAHMNQAAAESRIRDADVAEELVLLTRAGILREAGVGMMGATQERNVAHLQTLLYSAS